MAYVIAFFDELFFTQARPGCIIFKTTPLECEEEMMILFDSICVTNATSFVPGGTEKALAQGKEENRDNDTAYVEKEADQSASIPSPTVGK
jgi:hypothetical protein